MYRLLTWLILGIAALGFISGDAAITTSPDPLTAYCNKKRGPTEAKMVKKQCKCSIKLVVNPNFDFNSCVNVEPSGVIPKFLDGLRKIYLKVDSIFGSNSSCQDESGFSSAALTAASTTVASCCRSLAQYQSCVQTGVF